MKKQQKWFTLLEIIIVLLLIGILMVAFKQIFQPKDQNTLYGQSCVNILYGEINNFVNAGMTSKNIYTGEKSITVQKYIIEVEENIDTIKLSYQIWLNTTWNRKIYNLSGGVPNNFYCQSTQYNIKLSWTTNREIIINRGFAWQNETPFKINKNNNNQLTGTSKFIMCDKDNNLCKEIARIDYDSRTKYISKKLCISYTWVNQTICNERDK